MSSYVDVLANKHGSNRLLLWCNYCSERLLLIS